MSTDKHDDPTVTDISSSSKPVIYTYKMDLKSLCVILFTIFGLTVAECPNGWTVFDGSCYLFPQQPANFLDANSHCSLQHGHLVNIGSAKENTFIKSFVTAEKDHTHLIGLNDIAIEGVWNWIDTGATATFTDWYRGQPEGGTKQNCVALVAGDAYRWHDGDCAALYHFICEKPQNVDEVIVG